jgi:hypothetical protein
MLASKVVNPFTRDLAPPFIGRRRDFYILRIPSNLRNIPSVNTYINVFYIPWFAGLISYIYKPATSSHVKPRLLRQHLWLGFLLVPEFLVHGHLRTSWPLNLNFTRFRASQIHDSRSSWVYDSSSSQIRDFKASQVHDSRSSQIRDFKPLQFHDSRSLQIHDFKASQVSTTLKWTSDSREEARLGCHFRSLLKNLSCEFWQTRRFEGVRFFLIPQHCPTVGANVGGSEKSYEVPEYRSLELWLHKSWK